MSDEVIISLPLGEAGAPIGLGREVEGERCDADLGAFERIMSIQRHSRDLHPKVGIRFPAGMAL